MGTGLTVRPRMLREHLGTSDTAIIFMRRLLMAAAERLQQGIEPELPGRPDRFRVLPIDTISSETDLSALWQRHETGPAAAPIGSHPSS
jgi:hypothetical protein